MLLFLLNLWFGFFFFFFIKHCHVCYRNESCKVCAPSITPASRTLCSFSSFFLKIFVRKYCFSSFSRHFLRFCFLLHGDNGSGRRSTFHFGIVGQLSCVRC